MKDFLQKLLARPVFQAAALFSSRSFNSLLTLLFSLLAGRLLAVEDYGVFSQALARIVVVQAFAELGMQHSVVRFLSPSLGTPRESLIVQASVNLKLFALLGAGAIPLMFVLAFAVSPSLMGDPDLLPYLVLIFIGGAGMSMLSYLDGILVSRQSYARLSLWWPSVGTIRLSALGLFALNGGETVRAEHVIYAFSLAPWLAMTLFFLIFPASYFLPKTSFSRTVPWMKKLLLYNSWIVLASVVSIISDWMEVLLLQDAGQTGLFNAARMPMQGFLILLGTMQSFLLPRLSKLKTRDEFASFFKRLYGFLLPGSLVFLPGFWIFAWFIPFWFGPEYLPSVRVFWILYPNFICRMFFAPLGVALFALDQPRLIFVEAALRMGAGLVLNLTLIPIMGIQGAAWASLCAQFFGWVFLLFCYWRYFKTGSFRFRGPPSPRFS